MNDKKIQYIFSLVIAVIATFFISNNYSHQGEYYVSKVIDGDTIQLANGSKVRFIGVNTPETNSPQKKNECFGQEAKVYTTELLKGEWVNLEKDVSETDKFGRLLRYVYLGDTFVNKQLVQEGYAYASSYPPDVKYQEIFTESQKNAQQGNKGLWNKCR